MADRKICYFYLALSFEGTVKYMSKGKDIVLTWVSVNKKEKNLYIYTNIYINH